MIFGLVSGLLGTWAVRFNELESPGSVGDDSSFILAIPSLPGNIIAWQTHGAYDWGIGEEWDFTVPIALWNGVFWAIPAAIGAIIWCWRKSII